MTYIQHTAKRIASALPAGALPDAADELLLLYAVLARSKGRQTTPEDVHDAWTAWMVMCGETHESMRPYDELPQDVRREDDTFVRAIHAAADVDIHDGG